MKFDISMPMYKNESVYRTRVAFVYEYQIPVIIIIIYIIILYHYNNNHCYFNNIIIKNIYIYTYINTYLRIYLYKF